MINLHGHIHTKNKFFEDMPFLYNISVDANNNKLDIKVPLEMQKGSLYTRIFTLCPYVAKYIMDKERAEKKED